jgi:hypothetical protein
MDLSFPIKEHLSEESYQALLNAARNFNASKFAAAKEVLNDLLEKVDKESTEEASLIERAIYTHWLAKVEFATGEFLSAYQHAQSIAKFIKPTLDAQSDELKSSHLIHWLLKA